jgi:hypothetical protein
MTRDEQRYGPPGSPIPQVTGSRTNPGTPRYILLCLRCAAGGNNDASHNPSTAGVDALSTRIAPEYHFHIIGISEEYRHIIPIFVVLLS